MKQLQPVIWTKGTFLSPQHLQLQDRFLENLLQFQLDSLTFRPWGFRSLQISLRKRPVDPERVEKMVSAIVRELESGGEAEVSSEAIGEIVMEHLRQLDDVAYVRFASVYRNFREAKDFEAVLGELSAEDDARVATLRK